MRTGVARFVVLVALLSGALLSACASYGARPAEGNPRAVAAGAASSTESTTVASASPCSQADGPDSRWRQMTWAEYYLDVESQAWRRGGRVIWIEPPRVSRAAREQRTCVR
jgi:hypothetical protein